MIIDKPGTYILLENIKSRSNIAICTFEKGNTITITQVDKSHKKVIGPDLLDWLPWDLPVEEA